MKGRSDQSVVAEHPLDTPANPLCESLARPKARGLHPLGVLARTHVN
jgi:hypothetical protein